MKVVWTHITQYLGKYHFTYGKTYDIIREDGVIKILVSDNNYEYNINWNDHFIPLQDWRDKQIDKIIDG